MVTFSADRHNEIRIAPIKERRMEIEDIPELELTLAQWRQIVAASQNKTLQNFLDGLKGMGENDPFVLVPARSDWVLRLSKQLND